MHAKRTSRKQKTEGRTYLYHAQIVCDMQFTHTHAHTLTNTLRAEQQTGLHSLRGGPTLAALLAVTVAMPKANCIFEAYINIFLLLQQLPVQERQRERER